MLLFEFLAVGTWTFWLVLCVTAVVMSELLDHDRPGYASLLAVALVTVLVMFGNFNPISLIVQNPLNTLLAVVGYFVVGSVWGAAKWFFWLRKIRTVYEDFKVKYQHLPTSDLKHAWYTEAYRRGWPTTLPPEAVEHKSMIVGWMSLWPSSMIWTLLHDPVKWIFEEIFSQYRGLMQRISTQVFKDFS